MADTSAERAAREAIRQRERAIWREVEQVGRELRAKESQAQTMTQADRDAAKKPAEGMRD